MTSLYAPRMDDVKSRLRPFGIFFEKSLKDLIKGIRANNETPEKLQTFLDQAISECREEVTSPDFNLKTNAVLKLTYLEMYGYDMSWANFHILEVMSSNKLQQKRVGYLAASQSFYNDSEILMLATNLMRKDLKYDGNHDVVKVGIALSGLSTIVTPSLAADICDDLFTMLTSSKPYIRKKAVTALFKVFLQYPEALRDNFDKFVAKLEDEDTTVVSATVSVVCELSKMNPAPFIVLSPLLYDILVTVSNNWIIIRLLKLFTNLSKIEPKLRPKLLPKIVELMDSTMATSVLYESINCIVKGNILQEDDYDTAMICLDRLHTFCDSSDPNLRYISCVLFYKIGKINTDFISKFDKLVFRLLNDVDVSIRSKAVELIEGIISENNIKSIITVLLKQFVNEDVVLLQTNSIGTEFTKEIPIVIPDSYKIKMINIIIHICNMNNYVHMNDFEWYNSVLWDLATLAQDLPDQSLGTRIGEQLRNLMVKVPSMREYTLMTIIKILSHNNVSSNLPGILKDCFWSLGEFSSHVDNGDDLLVLLIEKEQNYSPDIQKIMVPAMLKVFSKWCNGNTNHDIDRIKFILNKILRYFESFIYSKYFEVQERSVEGVELLKLTLEAIDEEDEGLPLLITEVLPSLFNTHELKPISQGAQQKIQGSINVDCQTPFLTDEEYQRILSQEETNVDEEFLSEDSTSSIGDTYDDYQDSSDDDIAAGSETKKKALSESELLRKEERESNPFYLEDEYDSNKKTPDLLDMSDARTTPESSTLITFTKHHPPDKSKDKATKKKKKSTNKRRVEIIPDEIIIDDNGSPPAETVNTRSNGYNQSTMSLNSLKGKINLKAHTKLEDFDFSKKNENGANSNDEQEEVERMRIKFENQSLRPDNASEEDVIIIKKKKSSKKKKKSIKKKKEKNKDSDNITTDLQ